ncbi:Gamma-irradiation and mitomycin c induced 1, putative isoform 1 [Theobroma cacao]|uniref:Gamma-irradiation and mitomycin c induced 1, putative isoform 1 n=1 Tax=Theobroma cacao TaxID=3641 RepID=A0A061G944_THECC|nr:Gamma-irradiation and mitomycin c induced 1, putative isoform 1 [Theobroma cacao]
MQSQFNAMEDKFHRRASKRPLVLEDEDDADGSNEVYRFKVLLPNGTSVDLSLKNQKPEISFEDFIDLIRVEYDYIVRSQRQSVKRKRIINWNSEKLYLEGDMGGKIMSRIKLRHFKPLKCHILRLHDGSGEVANTYENMWDLTPDTDLLMELPEEYTFETALADLIDNSLQAVWLNGKNERRLISVNVLENTISIFDTGPGMDSSDENSIVKWGKMGASLNRLSKVQAIGCKPPYLMPFFGMFGYGGPIASMHLGSCAIVSSKTKESKKVYTLQIAREALLNNSNPERCWRTDGGIRDASEDEIEKSPHQSFTKVEILKPKQKNLDIFKLQCKLKDTYFPYIQCDELSKVGRTITPVEFQVNGVDLTEIDGGEAAITNLLSCNGPEFSILLHFSLRRENVATKGSKASQEANARLKCIYFPIRQGKENIERILERLGAEGCGVRENYEDFSRVSIRRLGRLLPDARWALLPFMDLRQRKGDKSHLLKRCCLRVKCFVETDAGFNPTPSKTDLAHHNPFSIALKNFGSRHVEKEKDVDVDIYRGGKQLTFLQLEREYQDWLLLMHDSYDEEIVSGEDQPVLVVGPLNKKALGISSDVIRVHKILKRKGVLWKRRQRIKVLKGACAGFHKNNVYATLEYFLIEGFQGDFGGEARIICRPLGLSNGSILSVKDGNASFDIRSSLSLPVSVIDSGKCLAIDDTDWDCQLEKQCQKAPSRIDLLNAKQCQELEVDGALPADATVHAGLVPPKEIVAVLRPRSFGSSSASNDLEQKDILKINLEMSMEVNFRRTKNHQDVKHIYSGRITPSSHKGFNGLYVFPIGSKFTHLFQVAGLYTFLFSIEHSGCQDCKKTLLVVPSLKVGKWRLLSDGKIPSYNVRVGSCFALIPIACYDIYGNRMPFSSIPNFKIKLVMNEGMLVDVTQMKPSLSSDNLVLNIEDVMIESNGLDSMRPHYAATLVIYSKDESVSISVECQVTPGALRNVRACPEVLGNQLLPGFIIEQLVLEMFDAYGNHVAEGAEVQFHLDGFVIQGHLGSKYKVDDRGCIDLGGLLEVTAGYGKSVSLSVLHDGKVVFKREFQTEKRELRIASVVPERCIAGSILEDLAFEVVDSQGVVDETFHDDEKHGQSHRLIVNSESFETCDSICYAFIHGCCIVTSIPLPEIEGPFCFVAFHSRYMDLYLNVKVSLVRPRKVESDEIEYPSDQKGLFLQKSQSVKDVGCLLSLVKYDKELEDEVCKYGERIAKWEHLLETLDCRKASIERYVSGLQASLEPNLIDNLDSLSTKEEMMIRIKERDHSAASVLCSLAQKLPFQEPWMDVIEGLVGVVALLGTVCTSKLSRILAEYLGEDQMLAVVCKSYTAARALEKYEHNGKVDWKLGLHAEATALGKSISGRFLVVCLEDIRPYPGLIEVSDPQRKLALPDPRLPTGNTPPGFIGYAVNMVNIDHPHLENLTTAGHGLRETLFYRLFSKLQVYETREHMENARACIKHSAISLDGGILRKNGIISLGYRNPEIHFPVQMHVSQQHKEIMEQIKKMKLELRSILQHIERISENHAKASKKFNKRKMKLEKCMDRMDSTIKYYHVEYAPNTLKSEEAPPM